METKEDQIEKTDQKVSQTEEFFEGFVEKVEDDVPENCPFLRDLKDTLRDEGLEIE